MHFSKFYDRLHPLKIHLSANDRKIELARIGEKLELFPYLTEGQCSSEKGVALQENFKKYILIVFCLLVGFLTPGFEVPLKLLSLHVLLLYLFEHCICISSKLYFLHGAHILYLRLSGLDFPLKGKTR